MATHYVRRFTRDKLLGLDGINVPPPGHAQVGVNDSDGTFAWNGPDGQVSSASRTQQVAVTAAQIKASHGTPTAIITAPDTGYYIVVDEIIFEMTTTATAYANGGAVSFVYTGGSVPAHAGSIPATTVTAGAGSSITMLGPAVDTNGTVIPSATGISLSVASAEFITGTGTALVKVRYRVLKVGTGV